MANEIDDIEAGPELDALIAEKVLGWKRVDADWWKVPEDQFGLWSDKHVPKYSIDIAVAWEVVEKLSQSGVDFYLERDPYGKGHWARFNDTTQGTFNRDGCEDKRLGDSHALAAPLAICRAALKAVHNG